MTNTLHRYGKAESFRDDYIIFAIPSRGKNDEDCIPKLKQFLLICAKHNPTNMGNGTRSILMPEYLFLDVNTIRDELSEIYPILFVQTNHSTSIQPDVYELLDRIQPDTSSVLLLDENYINQKRLFKLKKQFTPRLLNLILESDFEYGILSGS